MVTELNLTNNGLSGKVNSILADLILLEVLAMKDNGIKVSVGLYMVF